MISRSRVRIDAHHHLWRYTPEEYGWIDDTMAAIRRDFMPEDLERELSAAGIAGAVVVQARQTLQETHWLLKLAENYDFMRAVVGWAPIADSDFIACLDNLLKNPKLKGLRHVIQGEPDDNYILSQNFNRGIRALEETTLVYDILILERHLPQTIKFVDRHPKQVFVLDHLAKPLIAAGTLEPWATRMRELAQRDNVFCKISGLVTESDWIGRRTGYAYTSLLPYLDVVVEAFKPQRLMAGSDWPVCLVGVEYSAWFKTMERYFCEFSTSEQEGVFGANASRIYRLDIGAF